jgi:hypothetical protein
MNDYQWHFGLGMRACQMSNALSCIHHISINDKCPVCDAALQAGEGMDEAHGVIVEPGMQLRDCQGRR